MKDAQSLQWYVVEYDENCCAWLVHVETKERISLEHGMQLAVDAIWAMPAGTLPEEPAP